MGARMLCERFSALPIARSGRSRLVSQQQRVKAPASLRSGIASCSPQNIVPRSRTVDAGGGVAWKRASSLTVHSRRSSEATNLEEVFLEANRLTHVAHRRDQADVKPLKSRCLREENSEGTETSELRMLPSTSSSLWSRLVRLGDTVVDATCGNGHDTAVMAEARRGIPCASLRRCLLTRLPPTVTLTPPLPAVQLALRTHGEGEAGRVVGFDLQQSAIESTRSRLQKILTDDEARARISPDAVPHLSDSFDAPSQRAQLKRVELYQKSHSLLSEHVAPGTVKLVAFNTGYLPGAPCEPDQPVTSTLHDAVAATPSTLQASRTGSSWRRRRSLAQL